MRLARHEEDKGAAYFAASARPVRLWEDQAIAIAKQTSGLTSGSELNALPTVIDEIDAHLKEHMEEYEGVELYPLTAEEVEARINAQFDKDGTVPEPVDIIRANNEEKMAHVRKTRLGTKLAGGKIVDEDELDSTPARLHREAPEVDTSDMDEDSAIAAELAAFDRKQAEVLRRARG